MDATLFDHLHGYKMPYIFTSCMFKGCFIVDRLYLLILIMCVHLHSDVIEPYSHFPLLQIFFVLQNIEGCFEMWVCTLAAAVDNII